MRLGVLSCSSFVRRRRTQLLMSPRVRACAARRRCTRRRRLRLRATRRLCSLHGAQRETAVVSAAERSAESQSRCLCRVNILPNDQVMTARLKQAMLAVRLPSLLRAEPRPLTPRMWCSATGLVHADARPVRRAHGVHLKATQLNEQRVGHSAGGLVEQGAPQRMRRYPIGGCFFSARVTRRATYEELRGRGVRLQINVHFPVVASVQQGHYCARKLSSAVRDSCVAARCRPRCRYPCPLTPLPKQTRSRT